ncbi:MAG: TPM domain-containing protein [Bacteroidetes bacterium]|nr:MAG: TPM domain-containing protein [Bacteroidota bacterium]
MRVRLVLSFLLGFIVFGGFSIDENIPERPVPPRLVNDFSHILSAQELRALEKDLVDFNNTTGNQIAVVITDDLKGYEPNEFASLIGERWGVGQEGKDNGIVILIKPKRNNSKGQAYIAVGYGLESVVTDLTANQIVNREMIPYFKRNDYYGGIKAAVKILKDLALKVYSQEEYKAKKQVPLFPLLLVAGAMLMFILLFFGALFIQAKQYAAAYNVPLAVAWAIILERYKQKSSSSSKSGHSSGGGGFFWGGGGSSGGGGGFSGFGGGSFGGGGSGGSW